MESLSRMNYISGQQPLGQTAAKARSPPFASNVHSAAIGRPRSPITVVNGPDGTSDWNRHAAVQPVKPVVPAPCSISAGEMTAEPTERSSERN